VFGFFTMSARMAASDWSKPQAADVHAERITGISASRSHQLRTREERAP
jgi:hypothetical protein